MALSVVLLMLLEKILTDPLESLVYMERYVNEGSPSGYSFKHTSSLITSSRTGNATFELPYFEVDRNTAFVFGNGSVPESIFCSGSGQFRFFVHPDMVNIFADEYHSKCISPSSVAGTIKVSPLANDRTVISVDECVPYFIKLHYDKILGRINKSLSMEKSIAGPETSLELEGLLSDKQLPEEFAFFPEPLALVVLPPSGPQEGAGVILRNIKPLPEKVSGPLIPFFSLFSQDIGHTEDPLLLVQLLSNYENPTVALMERIVMPILRCYTYLTFKRGLVQESHSQNLLLGLEEGSFHPKYIVHRDLMGIYRDVPIRNELGLSTQFASHPYRCNYPNDENYYRVHSYYYDSKLGDYVFKKIVDVAVQHFGANANQLTGDIADAFWEYSGGQCWDHFQPRDKWYDRGDQLLIGRREFIEHHNPQFRHWKTKPRNVYLNASQGATVLSRDKA